ncbi:hypothetical protein [Pseudomonas orientalis]|uniref:hypothetical protein n=1 Tax=Pseudomonas orientalis TaxID=76758 RepID=UPI000F57A22F|nr:hypothetical protein [Pseudomonas orientalis]
MAKHESELEHLFSINTGALVPCVFTISFADYDTGEIRGSCAHYPFEKASFSRENSPSQKSKIWITGTLLTVDHDYVVPADPQRGLPEQKGFTVPVRFVADLTSDDRSYTKLHGTVTVYTINPQTHTVELERGRAT